MDRFYQATSEDRVRAALAAWGLNLDSEESREWYFHTNHGHNLFTTILVERGLVGIAFLLALLIIVGRRMGSLLHSEAQRDPKGRLALAMTAGGCGVLVSILVTGMANTTLMNEHGQVALILLALCHMVARWRAALT